MCSGNKLEIVGVIELLRDVLSKTVASTSRGDTPTTSVIRVGPQKIADGTFVGYFHDTIKLLDLVQSVDGRRQTTVQAEDVLLDDGGQGQVVEQAGELLPNFGVTILTEALIVESIDLGDLLGLVVSTKDSDTVGITNLHANQQTNGLNRVVATVNVVSHEEIVGVWKLTANLEQFPKIVELAVDITTNGHRSLDGLNILLLDENCLGCCA